MDKNCNNKRWMIVSIGVLVLVLATAGIAVSGFKSHFDRYCGKDAIKEHMLSKMDYTMQELKLSPEQQGQYTVIRERISKDMDSLAKRHAAVKDIFHSEMGKASPDIKTIAGTLKREVGTMPDRINAQIDAMVEIYGILDHGQQKQLIAMMKAHMAERDYH